MQNKKKRTIDDEVGHALEALESLDPKSKEYKTASENLKLLCEARGQKKATWLSAHQDLFVAAMSILQIVVMMNHERVHVFATKALGQLWKNRV